MKIRDDVKSLDEHGEALHVERPGLTLWAALFPGLSPNERVVLIAVARLIGAGQTETVGVLNDLCEWSGLSQSTVRKHLKQLEHRKIVSVRRLRDADGRLMGMAYGMDR
ncbi:helix-turn-helix domain-containing protein [Pseudoclavibacter alba]|uniref:Helix-turn-helix domain-containing protein n=1 Tax=Pseudoclavibacter albus TaxID=272241 RepID=A0ABT2HW02_9MICO|nr:helix-turn-helix domain-containing protein [Pseudoclavibacter alba]MCT2042497.1 helix-turn-helix domain-containing protein [Pseudoclavibacter alba]